MRAEVESLKRKTETPLPTNTTRSHKVETEAFDVTARADTQTPSRKELGKSFNVSHEAIRIWEENGKLKELGWERIPSAGNPVRYRQVPK